VEKHGTLANSFRKMPIETGKENQYWSKQPITQFVYKFKIKLNSNSIQYKWKNTEPSPIQWGKCQQKQEKQTSIDQNNQ